MHSPAGSRAALAAVAAGIVIALAGCGGGGEPPTTLPGLGAGEAAPPEFGEHAVRIDGTSPADVAGAAILSIYPEGRTPPQGWVLVRQERWQDALLAAQLAAKPVNAAILPIVREFLPTAAIDLMTRIRPSGFPQSKGLRVVILGRVGVDIYVDLNDLHLKVSQLTAPPAKLAADLVPFRGGWSRKFSDNIVIVSSEARDYALPGGAWSAYSGDTLAYVSRDSVPASTAGLLKQRQKLRINRPAIYVLGPSKVISDGVVAKLRAYGTVKRIGGEARTAIEAAVAFARFKDPSTAFGWGLREGPASVSLVNVHDSGNAVGALALAAQGPQAPLLLTAGAGSLPGPVLAYLRELRGEEPNQGYVFGDQESIDSATLQRLDRLLAPLNAAA